MATSASTANERLLMLDHEIRQIAHGIAVAKRRRKWGTFCSVAGPLGILLLYTAIWSPWIKGAALVAILIPGILVSIALSAVAVLLKRDPGGPRRANGRENEGDLELELSLKRAQRKLLAASADIDIKTRRTSYKEEAYADVDELRHESNRYRRVNNVAQGILIIGALAATGVAALIIEVPQLRWVTMGITFLVGIASGFMGYFKYKERSFYLQQTADAIEQEWEAVEVGIGRYKRLNEEESLADFVEEVHRLKSEQKKRQQNLEQPPDERAGGPSN